jgi:hypothetical protein
LHVDIRNIVLGILCKLERLQAWDIFFQFCDIENLSNFFAYKNKLVEFTLKIEISKIFPILLLIFKKNVTQKTKNRKEQKKKKKTIGCKSCRKHTHTHTCNHIQFVFENVTDCHDSPWFCHPQ